MLTLPAELLSLVCSFATQDSLPSLAATCRALHAPARRHQVWRVQGMKGLFSFLALLLKSPRIKREIRGLDFDPREKVVEVVEPEVDPATAPASGGGSPTTDSTTATTSPLATVTPRPTQPHSGGHISEFTFSLLALCLAQLPDLRHFALALLPSTLPAQLELVRALSHCDLLDSLLLSETRHVLGGAFLLWPAFVALLEALEGNGLKRLSAPVELVALDGNGVGEVPLLPVVRIKSLRLQLNSFTDGHLDRLSAALYGSASLCVVQLTGASPFLSTPAVLSSHASSRFPPNLKLLGLPIDAQSPLLSGQPFLRHAGMQAVVARGKTMLFSVLGERQQVGEMVRGLVGETKGKGWVEEMWIEGDVGKEAKEGVERELDGRGVELRWVK